MRSTLSLLALLDVAAAAAVSLPARAANTVGYHYFPIEFAYGYDSRVTVNSIVGSQYKSADTTIVLDTGSANFWMWAPNATIHWGSQYLGEEGPCNASTAVMYGYNPYLVGTATITEHNSTYAYAGNAKIVSGSQYVNDSITFGEVETYTNIPNIQFALESYGLLRIYDNGSCTTVPSYDRSILGLAPYTNTTVGPSFRQNLYENGEVESKVMTMWFDAYTPVDNFWTGISPITGGITFGAIDTSKYTGELVRVPNAAEEGDVGVYVPKPIFSVNGQDFALDEEETTKCLIDSGAHGDSIPFSYLGTSKDAFFNATGLVDYNGIVAYRGNCSAIPADFKLSYTFAGIAANETVKIDVPLRNYARGLSSTSPDAEGLCLLSLDVGGCVLGATWLSGAFLALDDADGSVGLAQGGVSTAGVDVEGSTFSKIGAGECF